MATEQQVPTLITFDGEARSGKGTIVQAAKDALRDEFDYQVMLIDAGQVFRSLVVMAGRSGISPDDPAAIDSFLSDDASAEACTQFVKDVYHMEKEERDALLYTNEISRNSAKFGARPLCQAFKDSLLKKWLRDAADEGYEIVLLDGRALEEIGATLENEKLCKFVMGLYFVCDPVVGARRTIGCYDTPYEELDDATRAQVDKLVVEINARNDSDRNRTVHPLLPPKQATEMALPSMPNQDINEGRAMFVVDTSADMTKRQMTRPVIELIARYALPQNG